MLRSLFLTAAYFGLLLGGMAVPFVATLGYVWVDIFYPHKVAYAILPSLPVSMMMGAVALGSYLVIDRRSPPRMSAGIILLIVWAVWVTLTTLWSELPEHAWEKWDWAFKTIVFAAFVPFVIRSRNQIEAFILTFLVSAGSWVIPYGAKTLISGGGYGTSFGLVEGNTGLSEGSTLSIFAASLVPVIAFLWSHGRLLPIGPLAKLTVLGLGIASIATVVGTHARAGILSLAVLFVAYLIKAQRRLLLIVYAALALIIVSFAGTDSWDSRMGTIGTYKQDYSAMGRIAVWKWTWQYALSHPLGGGFGVFRLSEWTIEAQGDDEVAFEMRGQAFHSLYFEILGEHGFVGIGIFGTLVLVVLFYLRQVQRAAKRNPELDWCGTLARSLTVSILAFLAGGAFVGVAFQPFHYYYFAVAIALREYVRRADKTAPSRVPSWMPTPGPYLPQAPQPRNVTR